MNGLDIALAVVLLFFLLRGIFRGFIKEIISIVGLVVAFVVSAEMYEFASQYIKPFIQNPAYRHTLGFLTMFMVIFIVIGLLGFVVDKLLQMKISKWTDGFLGAILGVIKGGLLSAVILMGATAFINQDSSFYKDSKAWPYMRIVTNSLREMIPEELQKAFNHKLETITPGPPPADLGAPSTPETTPPWKPVDPETGQPPAPAWPDTSESGSPSTDATSQ